MGNRDLETRAPIGSVEAKQELSETEMGYLLVAQNKLQATKDWLQNTVRPIYKDIIFLSQRKKDLSDYQSKIDAEKEVINIQLIQLLNKIKLDTKLELPENPTIKQQLEGTEMPFNELLEQMELDIRKMHFVLGDWIPRIDNTLMKINKLIENSKPIVQSASV